jgi:alpha-aminoadipate carrier protein LysW
VSATSKCPECDGDVTVGADAVKGEVVSCPDCGAELEVTGVDPVALTLAPEAEEDWGE